MCMVKVPKCPNGYTWLYQLGQSCVKVTADITFVVGTNTIAEHPVANSLCAQDNTRYHGDLNTKHVWYSNVKKQV